MHSDDFAVSAHQLVEALASVNPEVAPVELQRIGADDGPLVLRAGEHFSAVIDEDDEGAEQGTVAVRALVRALNALLARAQVNERLVPLVPGESRELYVGVTEEGAMTPSAGRMHRAFGGSGHSRVCELVTTALLGHICARGFEVSDDG